VANTTIRITERSPNVYILSIYPTHPAMARLALGGGCDVNVLTRRGPDREHEIHDSNSLCAKGVNFCDHELDLGAP
jgi:hypothetical protein